MSIEIIRNNICGRLTKELETGFLRRSAESISVRIDDYTKNILAVMREELGKPDPDKEVLVSCCEAIVAASIVENKLIKDIN